MMLKSDIFYLQVLLDSSNDVVHLTNREDISSKRKYSEVCWEYGLVKTFDIVGHVAEELKGQIMWITGWNGWPRVIRAVGKYSHFPSPVSLNKIEDQITRLFVKGIISLEEHIVDIEEASEFFPPHKNLSADEIKTKVRSMLDWCVWAVRLVETGHADGDDWEELHRLAVAKCLQSVGENLNKLSDETLAAMSEGCDAVGLIGLRNIIAHQYENIDWQKVDRIVEVDIPDVIETAEKLLK